MCIYINIYKTYRYAAYHTHSHEYVIRLNISHIQTALWIQFYHPKPLLNYITHSDCAGFWWLGVFTCQIKLVCCQCLKLIWSFSACVFKTASYYKKKAHSPNGEKKKKNTVGKAKQPATLGPGQKHVLCVPLLCRRHSSLPSCGLLRVYMY